MKETARECTSVNQAAGQIIYNLLGPSSEEIGRYLGSIFTSLPQFKQLNVQNTFARAKQIADGLNIRLEIVRPKILESILYHSANEDDKSLQENGQTY